MQRLAEDILSKLPKNFDMEFVSFLTLDKLTLAVLKH